MATIEQRLGPDGRPAFRVKVRVKGYPSQTETFPTKSEAKRWGQQIEADLRRRRFFTCRAATHP
jgi:hypothetical protein